jgi:hypothetical protein
MKRKMVFFLILNVLMFLPVPTQAGDKPGVVYAMTNAENGNEIVVYHRAADGTLP